VNPEKLKEQKLWIQDYRDAFSSVKSPWPPFPEWFGGAEWMEGLRILEEDGWIGDGFPNARWLTILSRTNHAI
jgi:hypothetical protein